VFDKTTREAKTSPIWLTEEKAITIFKSVKRRHNNLIKKPPIKEMESHKERPFHLQQIGINNQRPNLPSFNKIAAKIIEPITGASTCALGNQT
jgi:hypothetical protein